MFTCTNFLFELAVAKHGHSTSYYNTNRPLKEKSWGERTSKLVLFKVVIPFGYACKALTIHRVPVRR
jgi:hypothetical protein